VKTTLRTFWVLKVTLRDNGQNGAGNNSTAANSNNRQGPASDGCVGMMHNPNGGLTNRGLGGSLHSVHHHHIHNGTVSIKYIQSKTFNRLKCSVNALLIIFNVAVKYYIASFGATLCSHRTW